MFVERRNGVIVGVFTNPQPGTAEEYLDPSAPELLAYLAGPSNVELAAARAASSVVVIDRPAEQSILLRSLARAAVTENNELRSWIADFKVAVAGASSLAALKAAVAALPDMPPRTRNQVLQQIRDNCAVEAPL